MTTWPSVPTRSSIMRTLVLGALWHAVALLVADGVMPTSAHAWWDGNWRTRATLTLDNSAQPENLTDFPTLVVLSGTRIDYGKTQDLGEDLRFVDSDDSTVLAHEIEVWNEGGTSFVWVKIPQIDASSSSDFIYVYYDHGTAPDGQDSTAVWSNGYAAVWHLGEDPTGGNPVEDSSANFLDGVASASMNATNLIPGRIGNGFDFDGATDHVRVSSTGSDPLSITGDLLTLEAWAKRNGDTLGNVWMVFLGRQYGTGTADSYVTALKFDDPSVGVFNTSDGGSVETASGEIPDGEWRYFAGVQDATNITVFSNGAQIAQLPSGGQIQTDANDVILGGQENAADSTVDTYFVGTLDEIRVSQVARSPRWLAAQYLSMADSLITYGAPEGGVTISGTVFEDADFAGAATAYDGGVTDAPVDSVDVELYDADNSDAFVASTVTGRTAPGAFAFSGVPDGNYKVRVRSATMGQADSPPVGGLDASVPATWPYPLPEMTWGSGSALYGGQDPAVDDADTADDAGPGDTHVPVTISGGDDTGVDFGFAYNLIVSTRDDGLVDTARSDQGSLRQFLKNANAIDTAGSTTANASEFRIPITDPGYTASPLSYTIQPATALPVLADPTDLDATTQPDFAGTPVVVLNGAIAGAGVDGVFVDPGADASVIRGLRIERFTRDGIYVSAGADSVTIAGNWIGSDGTGASAPGNGDDGIELLGAYATIGGTSAADRNIINHSGDEGINVTGGSATNNVISGNFIGLEADGSGGSGNTDVGIALLPGAAGTTIGGLTPAERNVISNNYEGIEINTANNVVIGNYIGTDSTGVLDRGNRSDDGIEIQSASGTGNRIGGTQAGAGNLIAFNQLQGVAIKGGTDNTILGNSIRSNVLLGIDLANDGVTGNDGGDGDSGPNGLLNFPVITSATESGGTLSVDFDLDLGAPLAGDYRIEFFTNPSGLDATHGEGESFAGALTINHGGTGLESFSHSFAGLATDSLTATATDSLLAGGYGSTSEFSAWVPVVPAGSYMISGRVFEDADFAGTASAYDGGAGDALVDSVDVELYDADNADAFVASTITGRTAAGAFSFAGLSDGNYKVRVRSATLGVIDSSPVGGLNASVPATWPYPLPEMTWGNGSALYGGQDPVVDDTDTADDAGPGDAYVSVAVSGGDVTTVDVGFAYNLIVNTADDGLVDTARSDQGSLRQFLKNANAIGAAGGTTASSSEFRMQVATNQSAGPDAWWRITSASVMLGIADSGTSLDGSTQRANAGTDTNSRGPEIEVFGNGVAGIGLEIDNTSNVRIQELVVNGFSSFGVAVTGAAGGSNEVFGCYVGTDAVGESAVANTSGGVLLDSATSDNDVGGINAGEGSLISGNGGPGIQVLSSGNNRIRGNRIGTDRVVAATIPNTSNGIYLNGTSSGNTIGGPTAAAGNVVSGNSSAGIWADFGQANTTIQGNAVGTDPTGTETGLGNGFTGIRVSVSAATANVLVGGEDAGEGNLVAHNGQQGLYTVDGGAGIRFIGNTVRDNGFGGIYSRTDGVLVAKNLVSGNGAGYPGIRIADEFGSAADDNEVFQNTVHGNGTDGIRVEGTGAVLRNNLVTGNGGFGLDLAGGTMSESHNNVTGAATNPANASGRSNVALDSTDLDVDPLYVDAAGGDLSLTECTSPSINVGLDLGGSQPDMNGAAAGLFTGLAPDQGALESTCSSLALAITKRVFLIDGTPVPSGATVPRGTPIQYLLYVNNTGPARTDVSLQDILDVAFEYQADTIKFDASLPACATGNCSSVEELTIFTTVDGQAAGTDAVDGDTVSYTAGGRAVDVGDGSQSNGRLDIPANSVYAILFRVEVR